MRKWSDVVTRGVAGGCLVFITLATGFILIHLVEQAFRHAQQCWRRSRIYKQRP
jgi:hypothetical protein